MEPLRFSPSYTCRIYVFAADTLPRSSYTHAGNRTDIYHRYKSQTPPGRKLYNRLLPRILGILHSSSSG